MTHLLACPLTHPIIYLLNISYDIPYHVLPQVLDTLNTFKVAAELGQGSLGAYVISQCQQASDVMAGRRLRIDR